MKPTKAIIRIVNNIIDEYAERKILAGIGVAEDFKNPNISDENKITSDTAHNMGFCDSYADSLGYIRDEYDIDYLLDEEIIQHINIVHK